MKQAFLHSIDSPDEKTPEKKKSKKKRKASSSEDESEEYFEKLCDSIVLKGSPRFCS